MAVRGTDSRAGSKATSRSAKSSSASSMLAMASGRFMGSREERFEAECILVAGPATGLATDAAFRILHRGKHLGRFLLVDFLGCQHPVGAYLHAAATADALVVVYRFDEFWSPFFAAARKSSDVCHAYFLSRLPTLRRVVRCVCGGEPPPRFSPTTEEDRRAERIEVFQPFLKPASRPASSWDEYDERPAWRLRAHQSGACIRWNNPPARWRAP